MIPGGKVGALIGHRRAFSLGCVIYAAGSLTTALAPNYPTLIIGWSFLEGIGAALILPAIVALVAGNFAPARRPAAYGLIAAAAAVAIAVGPLIGGLATTYFSWRWVFAGEVVLVIGILILGRRIHDTPAPERRQRIDLVGAVMCACGLALVVFGVLRIGEWGFVEPKDGAPTWFGISPVLWLDLRRPVRDLALLPLGGARRGPRPRAPGPPRDVPQPAAHGRADDVLLPVPRAGGDLLRVPRSTSPSRSGCPPSRPASGSCRSR